MLFFFLAGPSPAQIAILQITVIEGEGAVHIPGSRSSRPLTVEITDEIGRPVAGAAVTFHIPDDGPGGTFSNGLRTAVTTTDLRGRATLYGLRVNRNPGRFQIRIFASKEQARSGTVSFQYIGETGSGVTAARPPAAASRAARPPAGASPDSAHPTATASRKDSPTPPQSSRVETRSPEPAPRSQSPAAPVSAAPVPAVQPAAHHRTKWFTVVALAGGGVVAGLLTAGRSGRNAPAAAPQPPALSIGSPTISLGKP